MENSKFYDLFKEVESVRCVNLKEILIHQEGKLIAANYSAIRYFCISTFIPVYFGMYIKLIYYVLFKTYVLYKTNFKKEYDFLLKFGDR